MKKRIIFMSISATCFVGIFIYALLVEKYRDFALYGLIISMMFFMRNYIAWKGRR
ncbi:MAG: hypothetical protein JEY94_17630 [Melioribacteraceae bacterium]|nr:hypothetical protein [Melioribacteraceae bacterium]